MKKKTKKKLWSAISGLFYNWGSDTPQEVLWNIPILIKGINHQFDLSLPDEIDNDDEYGSDYYQALEEAWKAIPVID